MKFLLIVALLGIVGCNINVPTEVMNDNSTEYYRGHMDALNWIADWIANYGPVGSDASCEVFAEKFGKKPTTPYGRGAYDALRAEMRFGLFDMP